MQKKIFKDFVMGTFTHPTTGEYGYFQIKELKDGQYLIPKLDANGDAILQANGSLLDAYWYGSS